MSGHNRRLGDAVRDDSSTLSWFAGVRAKLRESFGCLEAMVIRSLNSRQVIWAVGRYSF
jgi:hypothetical protein